MNKQLSIVIPARNEMFLAKTVEDILSNIEADTEIIVVLDGEWADPPLEQHERLTVVYLPESIGQRAATNLAVKLSTAKYVMKVDAHCSFDKGFDRKLIEDMQDNWTVVPTMRNLCAFDWVCPDAKPRVRFNAKNEPHRRYQSPAGVCEDCGKPTTREITWQPRENSRSNSYCFDSEPHFQYFKEYNTRPEGKGDLTESMSLQGSCFMLTREKYWELNISDEAFGSWGSQGIEVACKTWLSGGKVIVNKKTWYAHMFRTQGGSFGFPYANPESKVQAAKNTARELFFENRWHGQIRPLSWLLDRFYPINGWTDEQIEKIRKVPLQNKVSKGICYYADGLLEESIDSKAKALLLKTGLPITSATLKPMDFGNNFHVKGERGNLTMFKQILKALEESKEEVIFLCEADVLYHKSHFDFTPPRKDIVYYNLNVWKIRAEDGHALHYDCKQVSGICAYRELLVKHYRERVRKVEESGFNRRMGYEPGTHNRAERVDDLKSETWNSPFANLDIRHEGNFTASRWKKEDFRDQRNCQNWIEADGVIGWGKTKGRFRELLEVVL